ncbi:MAG: sigma-70 family RNA polymerase sigma factor [Pseudomonadota bacterium]
MGVQSRVSGLEILKKPKNVEASLWRRYRYEAEDSRREDLFLLYRDRARKIAHNQFRRRPPYGLERPDFEQLAYEGLLQAIDQYDPVHGAPFPAYSRLRILGSISDGLANSSENGRQYDYRRRLERARLASIRAEEPKSATDSLSELSDLVVDLAIGLVLEGTAIVADEATPDHHPDGYETLAWKELQISVLKAVAVLPRRELMVIENHYLHGVAFKQIACLLKVSVSRISQLHKSALAKLRDTLKAHE